MADNFDFSWDDTDDTAKATGLPNPNAEVHKPARAQQAQPKQLRGNMQPRQQGQRPQQGQ